MSDLRYDPVNDQWITIAGNRRERPMEYVPLEKKVQNVVCPFCRGNEDATPEANIAYQGDGSVLSADDDQSRWLVRVINNKYPSFSLDLTPECNEIQTRGPHKWVAACGAQELIIPTPRHVSSVSELSDHEALMAFWVYQQRYQHMKALGYVEHAQLFLNCGSEAGASLSHIHAQLIAAPVLGGRLLGRVRRNMEHAELKGCSLIRSMVNWEMEEGNRVLERSDNFCVYCPFASRFPFQIWIVPLNQEEHFEHCPDGIRDELAMLSRKWVQRLEAALDQPSYNMVLHSEPFKIEGHRHWFVEIFPRLTKAAGFEMGTDIWVNPMAPESAAKRLRVVD